MFSYNLNAQTFNVNGNLNVKKDVTIGTPSLTSKVVINGQTSIDATASSATWPIDLKGDLVVREGTAVIVSDAVFKGKLTSENAVFAGPAKFSGDFTSSSNAVFKGLAMFHDTFIVPTVSTKVGSTCMPGQLLVGPGGSHSNGLGGWLYYCRLGGTWGTVNFENYPDYAEYIPVTDATIGAGDIVAIDRLQSESITKASSEDRHLLAGVISSASSGIRGLKQEFVQPGLDSHKAMLESGMRPLALVGRVPVKITISPGENIDIGSPISVSDLPGIGSLARTSGMIAGRTLETFAPDTGSCQEVESLDDISWQRDQEETWEKTGICYQATDGRIFAKVLLFLGPTHYQDTTELEQLNEKISALTSLVCNANSSNQLCRSMMQSELRSEDPQQTGEGH